MTKQAINNMESEVKMSRRDSVSTMSSQETVEEAVMKIEEVMNIKPQERDVMEMVTHGTESRGMPIRYPASAFFNINSIDRYASINYPTSQFARILVPSATQNNNPASNYNMSLQRNLLSGYFHRLTVSEVNLQWNIPTINSQNYIFCLSAGDSSGNVASANVSLTLDYYTYTELAAALQAKIRSAFSALTPNLNALTVEWTTRYLGSGYTFVFKTNNPNVIIQFETSLADETGVIGGDISAATRAMYKLYNMIGVTNALTNDLADVLYTIPSYPTLIYTSYIDIISNKLSQFMRVKDSETSWSADTSVITRVYLSNTNGISAPVVEPSVPSGTTFDTYAVGSRPFVLNYSPNTVKNIKWEPGQSIIDFDIRVIDEFGDQVPWNAKLTQPSEPDTFISEIFEFQLTVLASET
jgi:hypothetical protein